MEFALTIAILGVVGALTSLNTPRNDLAQRAALAAPAPISDTQSANDVQVQLTITPGVVGQNTFTLALQDAQGNPITDASLIRLRFDDQTQNVGESELRITGAQNGVYTISGANLSLPGRWRIRTMIARPDHYDTVVDFKPSVQAAAPPLSVDPNAPLPNHIPALLIAGMLAFGVGGFFIAGSRFPGGAALLSCGLLLMGGVFLISAAADVTSGADTIATNTQADALATAVADCAGRSGRRASDYSRPPMARPSKPIPSSCTWQTTLRTDLLTYVDGQLTSRNSSASTLIALPFVSPGSHAICVVAGGILTDRRRGETGIHVVVEAP